jgi:hypothetical protein
MPPQITTRVLEERDYEAWRGFVTEASGGSPYALPAYLEALAEATGGRFRIVACERDGELLGGIALFERSSWAGCYVAPRLLLYYNGFVLSDGRSRYPSQRSSLQLRIQEALLEKIESLGYAQLRIHSRESLRDVRAPLTRGWQARPSYSYLMRLDDLDEAWKRVEGNFRRLVRRCEAEGMIFERN